MKVLFGFAVGYVLGSRAGTAGFERVEQAARDIRDSEEFQRLLAALKDLTTVPGPPR